MEIYTKMRNQNHISHLFEEEMASTSFYSRYDNPYDGDNPDGFVKYGATSSTFRDKEMGLQYGFGNNDNARSVSPPNFQVHPSPTFQCNAPDFLQRFNSSERIQGVKDGSIVGQYRIGNIIGMGAFSVVREAFHINDPNNVHHFFFFFSFFILSPLSPLHFFKNKIQNNKY